MGNKKNFNNIFKTIKVRNKNLKNKFQSPALFANEKRIMEKYIEHMQQAYKMCNNFQ